MKPLDKNYLSLQFKLEIHSKNGTEFQSFFENIMEKAFPNFKKVPSVEVTVEMMDGSKRLVDIIRFMHPIHRQLRLLMLQLSLKRTFKNYKKLGTTSQN